MKTVPFLSIPGIYCGHAQDLEQGTGCTVVFCPEGAVAGVDVRGGAPGTRETDLLQPGNMVEKVHGIFLAGGSAFGLNVADGVMKYLEEKEIGFDVGVGRVPIVTGAILFDLAVGNPQRRPDKKMGYEACRQGKTVGQELAEGCVGAGTGATIGKFLGPEYGMKGGLGAVAFQLGELVVGAITAVNCLGDIRDPATGKLLGGMLDESKTKIRSTEETMLATLGHSEETNLFGGNTTISILVTNASLTKAQAGKIASQAQDGYARTISPAHTLVDGDTIFVMGTGAVEADLHILGILATKAIETSVLRGIKKARSMYGYRAFQDL